MSKGVLQILVHFSEGVLCLGEEVVDYAFAEFALFLAVVHFEDLLYFSFQEELMYVASPLYLLEGSRIDVVSKVKVGAIFGLCERSTISTSAVPGLARRSCMMRSGTAVERWLLRRS